MPASGPSTLVTSVTTVAALRGIPTAASYMGEPACVQATKNLYFLDPTDVTVDDGVNFIKASDGGNWVISSAFGIGGSFISVPTVAALNAFAGGPVAMLAAGWRPGTWAYVQSQKSYYSLTVGGTWDRMFADTVFWVSQGTLHISVTGLPDNTGQAGSPITLAEARARTYNGARAIITQPLTLQIDDAAFTDDLIYAADIRNGASLQILGTETQTNASAFTAWTARVPSTNTPNQGTNAAENWTNRLNQLIRDTTAVSRPGAWVVKDQGGNVGRISTFLIFNIATTLSFPNEFTPGNTDNYATFAVTTASGKIDLDFEGPQVIAVGGPKVQVGSLKLSPAAGLALSVRARGVLSYLTDVIVDAAASQIAGGWRYVNVQLTTNFGLVDSGDSFSIFGGYINKPAGFFFNNVGFVNLATGFLAQGGRLLFSGQTFARITDAGIFDVPALGSEGGIVDVQESATVEGNGGTSVWGSGNGANTCALQVENGGVIDAAAQAWATTFPVTVASANLITGINTTGTFAFDAAGGAFTAARNLTLALLDTNIAGGGFASNYDNPRFLSYFHRSDQP